MLMCPQIYGNSPDLSDKPPSWLTNCQFLTCHTCHVVISGPAPKVGYKEATVRGAQPGLPQTVSWPMDLSYIVQADQPRP